MTKLDMKCYFCDCNIIDAKHFSVDSNSNVIIACDNCYQKVQEFCGKGGKKNVKSGLRDKRPE